MTRSDRSSSTSRVDVISLKTFVSSAKAAIWLDLTASGREFTYRRNNLGPRIDPCRTPEVTGKGLDVSPNKVTCCDRLCRYDSSRVSSFPPPPPPQKKNYTVEALGVLRGLVCQKLLTCPDRLYLLVLLYPALCQFGLNFNSWLRMTVQL